MFLGLEPGPTADPALTYPSPTDLRFSQLGSREVKLHWSNPAKPVQQYRVVYHSAEGQSPQEVRNVINRYIRSGVPKLEGPGPGARQHLRVKSVVMVVSESQ